MKGSSSSLFVHVVARQSALLDVAKTFERKCAPSAAAGTAGRLRLPTPISDLEPLTWRADFDGDWTTEFRASLESPLSLAAAEEPNVDAPTAIPLVVAPIKVGRERAERKVVRSCIRERHWPCSIFWCIDETLPTYDDAKLAAEVRQVLASAKPGTGVQLENNATTLSDTQIAVLVAAGYTFSKWDCMAWAEMANVRVLTLMFAGGGLVRDDVPWDATAVLAALSAAASSARFQDDAPYGDEDARVLKNLDDMKRDASAMMTRVEACADLVFESANADRTLTFPHHWFLRRLSYSPASAWPAVRETLLWFFDRAAHRYPMETFATDDEEEFAMTQVAKLAAKSEPELAARYEAFVRAHSRRHRHPATQRSRL